MPLLVGRPAPDFVAPAILAGGAIIEKHRLRAATKGKYALLFFNPLALTVACSSELSALDKRVGEFRRRGAEILGVSLDAHHRHSIWRNVAVDFVPPLGYTLFVDVDERACRDYGLRTPDGTCAHRGAFLIDTCGVVRYQAINELPLKGEIDDLVRMLDALQAHEGSRKGRKEQARLRSP